MKLSILIPTHNRSKLFIRAFNSIVNALKTYDPGYTIEVIVNNDSHDIQEIYSDMFDVKYFYEESRDLSKIYQKLFDEAQGEYIYYLEDDDYILNNFFRHIDLSYHWCFLNYMRTDIRDTLISMSTPFYFPSYNDSTTDFQLGQLIFRKALVIIPDGNYLQNDYEIFKQLESSGYRGQLVKEYCFQQTQDAKDNISDIRYNKDIRWEMSSPSSTVLDTKFNDYTSIGI